MTEKREEVFISVDVETSGPIPGEYSMLSIGACSVSDPGQAFECKLKPIGDKADPAALDVTGLSMEDLIRDGLEPGEAMRRFADWVATVSGDDGDPVFVGFNAPFDWSFVNYYFHRFDGANPFGFAALDIKSMWMGIADCRWSDTRSSRMTAVLGPTTVGDHDALHDARHQAEMFRLAVAARRKGTA